MGKKINAMFSNPVHQTLRRILDTYFDHPTMQKIKDEDATTTSVYMCRIASLLLNEQRYLVAIVHRDDAPIGSLVPLVDLHWTCFQSRILEGDEFVSVRQHSYMTKRELGTPVHRTQVNSAYSSYRSDALPIDITLLHTSDDEYEYPATGTLASCLETYRTIIRFTDA